MSLHPMQIKYVGVRELILRTFLPPDLNTKLDVNGVLKPKYRYNTTEYDDKSNTIMVFADCEMGADDTEKDIPLYLKVSLGVHFQNINPDKFSKETAMKFAKEYSHFMIHPFLREHVFALSARSGLPPIILPSLQVPIFSKAEMVTKQ